MKDMNLRVVFESQERLNRIAHVIKERREELFGDVPELISIYPVADLPEYDKDGNILADKLLGSCRVKATVSREAPGLRHRIAAFFPGFSAETVESDLDPRMQPLSRQMARNVDRLQDILNGPGMYSIEIRADGDGAYFNVNLHDYDSPDTRQAVRDMYSGTRVVFCAKDDPSQTRTPGQPKPGIS